MVSVDGQSPLVPRRSGASVLSVPCETATPPMDVVVIRLRKTQEDSVAAAVSLSSSSSSTAESLLNGKPTQLLSRSLSGSTLNAKAPEFVPKCVSSLSSSLPGPVQGLGLSSPPTLIPSPSSLPPVIVAPLQNAVSPPSTVVLPAASPPDGDLVSSCDHGAVVVGQEHDQNGGSSHGSTDAAAAPPPAAKSVVTEELKAKIVKQVEFYFSDTNLPTDNYLMKYVKKDPQGFVPIPVVASFRKIKNLVKNHGVVAAALRNSPLLVVSEDGKKVRRVHPLPEINLEEVQARTVVAENLPADHSIETIERLFGKVGNVKMVRICHPEAANGANQTASKLSKSETVISNKLHALVEYETIDLAEKAVTELTDEHNWRSGLHVQLLIRRMFPTKHGYQQARWKVNGEAAEIGLGGEDDDGAMERGEDHTTQHVNHTDEGNESGYERDGGSRKGRGRARGRAGGRGRGQPHHQHSGTPPQTSFPLISELVGKPPPGPRMPDGTRGFNFGRGRLPAVKTLGLHPSS